MQDEKKGVRSGDRDAEMWARLTNRHFPSRISAAYRSGGGTCSQKRNAREAQNAAKWGRSASSLKRDGYIDAGRVDGTNRIS